VTAPDPTDEEIEARLRLLPVDRRAALEVALADFRLERSHGSWEGAGEHSLGWVERSPGLDRLVTELAASGLVFPFDWRGWQEAAGFDGSVGGLRRASVADAVRWLTSVLRGDRFVEGLLLEKADDASLAAGVERVLAWLRA
jgi:hypothetical protein